MVQRVLHVLEIRSQCFVQPAQRACLLHGTGVPLRHLFRPAAVHADSRPGVEIGIPMRARPDGLKLTGIVNIK